MVLSQQPAKRVRGVVEVGTGERQREVRGAVGPVKEAVVDLLWAWVSEDGWVGGKLELAVFCGVVLELEDWNRGNGRKRMRLIWIVKEHLTNIKHDPPHYSRRFGYIYCALIIRVRDNS